MLDVINEVVSSALRNSVLEFNFQPNQTFPRFRRARQVPDPIIPVGYDSMVREKQTHPPSVPRKTPKADFVPLHNEKIEPAGESFTALTFSNLTSSEEQLIARNLNKYPSLENADMAPEEIEEFCKTWQENYVPAKDIPPPADNTVEEEPPLSPTAGINTDYQQESEAKTQNFVLMVSSRSKLIDEPRNILPLHNDIPADEVNGEEEEEELADMIPQRPRDEPCLRKETGSPLLLGTPRQDSLGDAEDDDFEDAKLQFDRLEILDKPQISGALGLGPLQKGPFVSEACCVGVQVGVAAQLPQLDLRIETAAVGGSVACDLPEYDQEASARSPLPPSLHNQPSTATTHESCVDNVSRGPEEPPSPSPIHSLSPEPFIPAASGVFHLVDDSNNERGVAEWEQQVVSAGERDSTHSSEPSGVVACIELGKGSVLDRKDLGQAVSEGEDQSFSQSTTQDQDVDSALVDEGKICPLDAIPSPDNSDENLFRHIEVEDSELSIPEERVEDLPWEVVDVYEPDSPPMSLPSPGREASSDGNSSPVFLDENGNGVETDTDIDEDIVVSSEKDADEDDETENTEMEVNDRVVTAEEETCDNDVDSNKMELLIQTGDLKTTPMMKTPQKTTNGIHPETEVNRNSIQVNTEARFDRETNKNGHAVEILRRNSNGINSKTELSRSVDSNNTSLSKATKTQYGEDEDDDTETEIDEETEVMKNTTTKTVPSQASRKPLTRHHYRTRHPIDTYSASELEEEHDHFDATLRRIRRHKLQVTFLVSDSGEDTAVSISSLESLNTQLQEAEKNTGYISLRSPSFWDDSTTDANTDDEYTDPRLLPKDPFSPEEEDFGYSGYASQHSAYDSMTDSEVEGITGRYIKGPPRRLQIKREWRKSDIDLIADAEMDKDDGQVTPTPTVFQDEGAQSSQDNIEGAAEPSEVGCVVADTSQKGGDQTSQHDTHQPPSQEKEDISPKDTEDSSHKDAVQDRVTIQEAGEETKTVQQKQEHVDTSMGGDDSAGVKKPMELTGEEQGGGGETTLTTGPENVAPLTHTDSTGALTQPQVKPHTGQWVDGGGDGPDHHPPVPGSTLWTRHLPSYPVFGPYSVTTTSHSTTSQPMGIPGLNGKRLLVKIVKAMGVGCEKRECFNRAHVILISQAL
ncbi:hypothetical protein E2C01_033651 [Portunus trituberculatus]|uniref:Uncharacterized protein n=1 Tax=Portunus trituberculatus TaxID=210409 RepID=A0A5B7F407_PORTR|nr:hypothetical protein [Portunus trituberculatus]